MHSLKLLVFGLAFVAGSTSLATSAWAQDYDDAIRGVKIVVPTARAEKTTAARA